MPKGGQYADALKDLQERARMEQWISIETENFSSHAMKFIYHSVFKREQPPRC